MQVFQIFLITFIFFEVVFSSISVMVFFMVRKEDKTFLKSLLKISAIASLLVAIVTCLIMN